MIKKITVFSLALAAFPGENSYAAKSADVKKLEALTKKKDTAKPLDLSGADMRGYDLTKPECTEMFKGANMRGTNFACKEIRGIRFENVNLESANFENADLSKASFRNCNLSKANFKGAKVMFGGFRNTNLSGANFTGAKFESVGFDKLKMTGVIFDGADFFRVSLVDVDHEGASFQNITKRDCSGFPWVF